MEKEDSVVLEGRNGRITLKGNVLRIESPYGDVELDRDDVVGFEFFKRTNHCTIRLRSGVLRIFPERDGFRFFVRI